MNDRFLTHEEVQKEIVQPLLNAILEDMQGMTLAEQRAYWYDLQTEECKFPANEQERKRYIENGF
jgi:hypothetical protein